MTSPSTSQTILELCKAKGIEPPEKSSVTTATDNRLVGDEIHTYVKEVACSFSVESLLAWEGWNNESVFLARNRRSAFRACTQSELNPTRITKWTESPAEALGLLLIEYLQEEN
jgi:hypothetical protein